MKIFQIFKAIIKKQAIWSDVGILGGREYGGGISQSVDVSELMQAYQGWVYACVSIISKNIAKVPIRLFAQSADGAVEIDQHILLDLLNSPNPIHTRFEIWELVTTWLELTGNAYLYIAKNKLGGPGEIWPIPPDRMKVVPDSKDIIGGYLYEYQGQRAAFDRTEIVHLRYPNPNSVYYGMGTLQAAAYSYDLDLYMKKYSVNLFKNDGRPTGVLMTDQVLDDGMINRMRQAWKLLYSGVDKAGKIAILQAGTKYERVQINPQEMDYLASRRATRDDILSIFGVPASKLGLVEDVNRANAEANDYTFQNDVILPKLRLIEAKLNKDLVSQIDPTLYIKYDSPVPVDKEFFLKERETNLKNFVTSINEERAKEGLEPASWGEEPWMPFNLVQAPSAGSGMANASYEVVEAATKSAEISKKKKDQAWRMYLALHTPLQEHFRKMLIPLFKAQRKEVLKNLEGAIKAASPDQKYDPALIDFILFSQQEWQEKFSKASKPEIQSIFKAGVEKALADLAAGNFEFDFRNPKATAFLEKKVYRFSFEVNQTTLNSLKKELAEGLDSGEDLTALTARVNKVFDFAEGWRSVRIARTETNISLNTGIAQAYEQSGLVKKKMWLTARDEDVRSSHAAMDGQAVPLDGKFETPSGELLDYPGDPNGSAPEVINCRCTLLPVTKE